MQNREEERPSEFKAEILQLPFVTVTSNKPVPEETTAEVTVQVKIENEESEIALQLPASKQTSSDISIVSSEENKLSQNTCLLESASEKLEHASAADISIATQVDGTLTVEAKRVEIAEVFNVHLPNPKGGKTFSEILIPCQTTEPLIPKKRAVLQNLKELPEATPTELRQLTKVKLLDKQGEDTLQELFIFLRDVTHRLVIDKRFGDFAKLADWYKVPEYETVIQQPMDLSATTFIFTDWEDPELRHRAGDHMINTNCSAVHTRQALCCKMSVEYDKFLESGQKWFCHMDDDNYVNLRNLLHLLSAFSHSQDVYVGRPSLDHPIEAADHVRNDGSTTVKFWFATGGAGFCISRGLALKMSPWASLGSFISTAERIRLPDDCTIGYIIEGLLEVKLHHSPLFHSHLENLQRLRGEAVFKQVTLSYGGPENKHNVVSVEEMFNVQQDPTRFKSVHCLLYPYTAWCPTVTVK
ncbi:UNVERIFIED_CONTAM: hypothetical protein K2H54_018905 [Gekko kuhli]